MNLVFWYACQEIIRAKYGKIRRVSFKDNPSRYYVGIWNTEKDTVAINTEIIAFSLGLDKKFYEQLLLKYMKVHELNVIDDAIVYITKEECDRAVKWVRHIFIQVILEQNGADKRLDKTYKLLKVWKNNNYGAEQTKGSESEEELECEEPNNLSIWQRLKNKFIVKSA